MNLDFKSYKKEISLLLLLLGISAISFSQNNLRIDTSDTGKNYNIVFLLPFNSQKVFINDLATADYYLPNETQISAELYQGALLALDSLKKKGFNATVYSYDISNDSVTIQNILKKKELKNANLIIGPLNGNALKQASMFAGHEHIPIISPLSAIVPSPEPNQFLILANATVKSHCEFIYDYLVQHELVHRTILVYRKNTADADLAKFIKDYRDMMVEQGTSRIAFAEITDSNALHLKDSLFFTDKNVIILASNDERYVRNMISKISGIQTDYSIEVVGMPTWSNFSQLPSAQLDSLNTIISASFYLDVTSPLVDSFKRDYHSKFEINPSANSLKGFNIMLYFGNQLLQFDNKFMGFFPPATLIGCSFKVVPVMKSPDVVYRENKSVYMLQFSMGKWKLAQ